SEADALVHAARECGVDGADLDTVKRATHERRDITALSTLGLSAEERIFVYAIATWLARVDGVVMPEEKDTLAKIGDALKLAYGDRTRASAASFKIAELAPAERPSKYDINALATKLEGPLSQRG